MPICLVDSNSINLFKLLKNEGPQSQRLISAENGSTQSKSTHFCKYYKSM